MIKLSLRDQIEDALTGVDARYVEIRVEDSESRHLRYRGRELEDVGRSSALGGNVRALADAGWGFASFNDLSQLKAKVAQAVHQAKVLHGEPITLADVDPVVATAPATVGEDPTKISLAEKKNILDRYAQIMMGAEGVQSSSVTYGDANKRVTFANTEGSFIEQERIDVNMRLSAMARKNGDVQQSGVSIGSLGDFAFVRELDREAQDVADKAIALLNAEQIEGGEYTVVLDPILAGVFIHEAFGHLSEADHIYSEPRLQEIMQLGRRFGGALLNVVDGATVPREGLRGSYLYDDEGVPGQRTQLIKDGVLVGRLHSRETAGKLGERPTGNARAINYRFPPIVRMTNTYIEPGEGTVDDLVRDVKDGVYVKNWYGGMTSMEMFTFSGAESYRIRNGEIAELCRPVMLSGNVFRTLENIDGIAVDLDMNQGGGCGKGGQSPLPVSNGSPHIRIQHCLLSGA
jgi:TldD protein